ncbi:Salutaridine reductase [Hordeum vulgare]|nr:Salutaridine reductase [Hordeum vulgare]
MVAPSPSVAAVERAGDLGAVLAATGTGARAKHSKAMPVVQRVQSVRAKDKLGAMSSIESAKLRLTDKNVECSGNSLPSFRILSAFLDGHLARILDDNSVVIEVSERYIISQVCAREEAQVALAEAAARCVAALV